MIPDLMPTSSPRVLLAHAGVLSTLLRDCARRPQLLSFLLIAASVCVSLAYVWFFCPLDLASDEAHYWDWSRALDWSYYSKGPLVAWLIRVSCELFGSSSIAVTGDLGAAVRLPAVLCHGAFLAGSYVLAAGVFRSPQAGLAIVACEVSVPLVRVGSVLMTIDPPFLACWCWSLVCVWKALSSGNVQRPGAWWVGAAAFTTLGTLAKYTMALFPIAIVGYLLWHQRSEFRRRGIWILLAGSILGWIPIVVWNARHDWASLRHVFGQVGGGGLVGGGFRWSGPLVFLGGQLGMLFGAWMFAFLAAGWRFQPNRERDMGVRLAWWCSVPVWSLFAVVSFVNAGQPNWPAPAYVGGFILAVAWVREQLVGQYSRLVRYSLAGTVIASLLATSAIHFPGIIRPTLARFAGKPTVAKPLPVRDLDISARLVGWKRLAAEVDRVCARVSKTGEEPVLAGTHWTLPGHLRFYCEGHPDVYAVGIPNQSDRHSQYDYWRPNPTKDAQAFLGRTFVIVGDIGSGVRSGFDKIEPFIRVTHSQEGVPIAAWTIWVCHGFRGFPESMTDDLVSGY
jgi:4-amino-4-deoxy-L-arabinose transferase-like glycosyltransferase